MLWTKMINVGIGEQRVNKGTFQRLLCKSGLKVTTLNSSRSRDGSGRGRGQTDICFQLLVC